MIFSEDTIENPENAGGASSSGKHAPSKYKLWRRALRIRWINAVIVVASVVLAVVALGSVNLVHEAYVRSDADHKAYSMCVTAAFNLRSASDYLTDESRLFVVTGQRSHLDNYLGEFYDADRRGQAISSIKAATEDEMAVSELDKALQQSNRLAGNELYAMRLKADAIGLTDMPVQLSSIAISASETDSSAEEKSELAVLMLTGEGYQLAKREINASVDACLDDLIERVQRNNAASDENVRIQLRNMYVIVALMLAMIVISIAMTILLVLWPSAVYAQRIQNGEKLEVIGAYELHHLVDAYNEMREENKRRTTQLEKDVVRDPLTGLLNRGAYDNLMADGPEDVALLLIDIDKFKDCNDTYGHDVGDSVLKKVARVIEESFRSSDYVCRIGGDEFVVVMTGITSESHEVVAHKVELMVERLRDGADGLPKTTLSVGIAFSDDVGQSSQLFRAADEALYAVKGRGRNGYAFYGR